MANPTNGNLTDSLKTDISLLGDMAISSSGDLATVSGLANIQQALWHRLITIPGALVHKPTYGVGIGLFQNDVASFANQQKIATAIQEQFAQDPRVQSVDAVSFQVDDLSPEMTVVSVTITIAGYTEQVMNFTPFAGVG